MEDKVKINGGNLKAYKTWKERRIQELRKQVGTGEVGEQTKTLMDRIRSLNLCQTPDIMVHSFNPSIPLVSWEAEAGGSLELYKLACASTNCSHRNPCASASQNVRTHKVASDFHRHISTPTYTHIYSHIYTLHTHSHTQPHTHIHPHTHILIYTHYNSQIIESNSSQ